MARVLPRSTGGRRLVAFTLVVIVATVASMVPAVVARAATTVVFDQPFHNNTADGVGGVNKPALPTGATGSNMACLTASGNTTTGPLLSCVAPNDAPGSGKLRLTDAVNTKLGGVFATTPYAFIGSGKALHVSFNLYQYGGGGADGTTFVFAAADPNTPLPPTNIGQAGGALGYSPVPSALAPGLSYAYMGIGFDANGAFSTTTNQGAGCPNPAYISATSNVPGQVVVRGPGNGTIGYCAINSTATTTTSPALTLRADNRAASAIPVDVVLNPTAKTAVTSSGLSVPAGRYAVRFTPIGGAARTLTGALPMVGTGYYPSNGWLTNGRPKQIMFGWVGSTGGVNDFHEIDDARTLEVDPAPILTVTQTSQVPASPQPGDPVTYTITPSVATGTSETAPVTVTQTLPAGVVPLGAFGTGWVCQPPSGQTITCTNSNAPFAAGSALPAITVVAIVTGTGVTPASVQSGTTATVSAIDAVGGSASSAAAGTVGPTPTGVATNPTSGPSAGGNSVSVSGTNITGANAIEIGTAAQFTAGTPTVLLPCPSGPAPGCFTVSGSNLAISSMPAHTAGPVEVRVVTFGASGTAAYTYVNPLTLTFPAPPAGSVAVAYTDTLTATGGLSPYTWSVSAGSLPPGLQLGASTGTITGTPTTAGTFSFTVHITDAAGATANQATSITINPGLLSITTPGAVDLGSAGPGSTSLTANLGAVTVIDNRGDPSAAWAATVSTTTFTTGAGGTGQTVPASRIAYATGTWTSSGTGTFTPATLGNGAVPGVGASWTAGSGANTVTWHPQVTFTLTQQQVAGQYAGTITHSVA